jgi:Leucine-rich repeat (LRR) protein
MHQDGPGIGNISNEFKNEVAKPFMEFIRDVWLQGDAEAAYYLIENAGVDLYDRNTIKVELEQIPESIVPLLESMSKNRSNCVELIFYSGESLPAHSSRWNLTHLIIDDSMIKDLENVCKIKSLIAVQIRNSKIDKIPETIGELVELTCLDLSYNDITEVPEALATMPKLRELNLSNNKKRLGSFYRFEL